jgi:hypothetical protein
MPDMDDIEIPTNLLIQAGYEALVRNEIELAVRRKADPATVVSQLKYIPASERLRFEAFLRTKRNMPVEEVTRIMVDRDKLSDAERWAFDRLTEAQKMHFKETPPFKDWVRKGCPNTEFPLIKRTPKEKYV